MQEENNGSNIDVFGNNQPTSYEQSSDGHSDNYEQEHDVDDNNDGEEENYETPHDVNQEEYDNNESAELDKNAPSEPSLANDDMVVDINGSKITIAELKKSRMLEADYTRKRQVEAQERDFVKSTQENLSRKVNSVIDYLVSIMPPEPDISLSHTDTNSYVRQQALHKAALRDLERMLTIQQEVEQSGQEIDELNFQQYVREANDNLIRQKPELKNPENWKKFNQENYEVAKSYGFSDDEISSTLDPRVRMLVNDAAYGRKAREAAAKVKPKINNAPPLKNKQSDFKSRSPRSAYERASLEFDKNPTEANFIKKQAAKYMNEKG